MATNVNITQITPPRVPLTDERTGAVSREWYRWFYNIYNITGGALGITPVINGGTGLNTIPTNGQLLIGNGTGYSLNTLGVGAGISVTNGLGTITLANTGVLSNIAGTGISVSGATGNVTITNTGVLSFSGGTTGLTPATATTGDVTLAGILAIANGGTNGSATPTAYGIAYGTGTAYAFTAAGTTGQILTATTGSAPTWATPAGVAAPVTKTANFTVADSDVWLINNKTGSTCTVTLPTASSWTGRVLRFQNYQAQTVVSASSNVVPLTGGAAATSILLASTGDQTTLVSDGTNWLVTQYVPNNILLLE
jgi:hypothetical protein